MKHFDRVFFGRFSSDVSAAVISATFAVWNIAGQSFHRAPSMIAVAQRWPGAEFLFGAFAAFSAVALGFGAYQENRFSRIVGWVLGFAVFVACFASTLYTLPSDPAAPVFAGMAFGYIAQGCLVTLRIR